MTTTESSAGGGRPLPTTFGGPETRAEAGLIEFFCEPADKDVIAEPVPARLAMPDWFRKLPAVTASELSVDNTGLTIKRCMPFLDALATGWIIPLAATVKLEISDGGRTVEAGWRFDRTWSATTATTRCAAIRGSRGRP